MLSVGLSIKLLVIYVELYFSNNFLLTMEHFIIISKRINRNFSKLYTVIPSIHCLIVKNLYFKLSLRIVYHYATIFFFQLILYVI